MTQCRVKGTVPEQESLAGTVAAIAVTGLESRANSPVKMTDHPCRRSQYYPPEKTRLCHCRHARAACLGSPPSIRSDGRRPSLLSQRSVPAVHDASLSLSVPPHWTTQLKWDPRWSWFVMDRTHGLVWTAQSICIPTTMS